VSPICGTPMCISVPGASPAFLERFFKIRDMIHSILEEVREPLKPPLEIKRDAGLAEMPGPRKITPPGQASG
jgi:hypothetical protein